MVDKKTPFRLDGGYDYNMTYESDCMWCKHMTNMGYCKAFPNGIPLIVWSAKKHHDKPIKGDCGIQFEKIKK